MKMTIGAHRGPAPVTAGGSPSLSRTDRFVTNYAFAIGFAILIFGALHVCYAAFAKGISGFWVFTGLELSLGLVMAILERWRPFDPDWSNIPASVVRTDILHFLFSSALTSAVISAFILTGVVEIATWLSRTIGATPWPGKLPFWIQLLLAVLIADFGVYWIHRFAHHNEWLWRVHSIHHSSERLYWLANYRSHPGNLLGAFLGMSVPLIILGCPGDLIAMVTVLGVTTGSCQHANVDARMGLLNWFINTPDLHRFHHSAIEGFSNYGVNLVFWDIVFGTRRLPSEPRRHFKVGIRESPIPETYLLQLAAPFRWKKLTRKAKGNEPQKVFRARVPSNATRAKPN